ncbi:glycosyltransferase family 39 protein [Sporomusa sp.]|uniref:ArnT family glycosyltransferase n=1 Tax=Sporomusa sp. TaxID=2078658 RepID=UPI002BAED93F|nr:glycosyltransferase family 39 protein [Sporomusa sp.]HWR41938.1 glycosyltransferase family 39 protein [Sporomusa sp.]
MNGIISIGTLRSRDICLGIFLASFLFYLLFSHLVPITDPVESNYTLTAKEMVVSSDWLSPRIYGNVWFDKPIFFYWLTAIAFKFFGFSDLAARLFPAFFAALGVVLIYWFLTKVSQPSVAFIGMLVMGTSLEYMLLAKFVITDMVFFVFNSAALVFFYLGYTGMDGTKRWYLAMYASLAFAVLTKGPVGLLLPGLVAAVFLGLQRNLSELRNMSLLSGVFLFSIIALPWYSLMYINYGSEFLNTFLGVHNYLRATVSEHPKDNVAYYYVIVFLLSMLPWSFLAIRAVVDQCKELSSKKAHLVLLSFIWASTYFIFYSLMATKYLTYTFPILFPVAILTAVYLDKLIAQGKTKLIVYWVGAPTVLAIISYSVVAYRYLNSSALLSMISILLITLLFTWRQAKGQNTRYVFGLLCLCQLVCYSALSFFVFPAIAQTRSEKGLAEIVSEYHGYKIGFYQFYSTSAVYYSGNVAIKIKPSSESTSNQSELLSWSSKYTMPSQTLDNFAVQSEQDQRLIIVPDSNKASFLKEAENFNPQLLRSAGGFSYYSIK